MPMQSGSSGCGSTSCSKCTSTSSTSSAVTDDNSKYVTVKSPIIGTFYENQLQTNQCLLKLGSTINKGDVLCVIETMKLFNEIESKVSGIKIVKVLVDEFISVEFDQPLFLVDPS